MDNPLSTTHQSRRRNVLKTDIDNDTKQYKVILIFNVAMTGATNIMRSTKVPFPPEEGSYCRYIVYSLFLFYYVLIGVLVLVYGLRSKFSKCCCKCTTKDIVNRGVVDISLIIAGVLYLAGDNIRMLYEDFETEVPTVGGKIPARELRSYVVAISLVFMIASRIASLIGEQIYRYRKIPKHFQLTVEYEENVSLANFWKTSKQTLHIPAGLHDKWKTELSVFELEPNGEPNPLHTVSNSQVLYKHLFTKNCVTSDGSCVYIEVQLFYFLEEPRLWVEFRAYEIIVTVRYLSHSSTYQEDLVLSGCRTSEEKMNTSPMTYSVDFVVTNEDSKETSRGMSSSLAADTFPGSQNIQESALTRLFGAYYKALDYVVIIDAIYTTILDEIVQGSKITPSSRYCPPAQISLIYVIFALVNIIWFVAVVWFFPCGFCCCIRKKHVNKWKEVKRQLCHKPKNIKVVCCSSQDVDQQPLLQNQQQSVRVLNPCYPDDFKILIYMAIGCTTLSVVYIFIILVSAVLFPISIIVMLIVLIIDYFCSRRCCKCYQDGYFGTVFLTFSIVCLLVIYLPVYMIADNAWPWICFLTENNWSIMRYVLLSFALVISIFPTLYKAISVQANLKLLEKNTPAIRQSQREEEHAIN